MQYLENEHLRVSIDEQGAEIVSLVRKSDGAECIWEGDSAFWGRHAPVLFPIIGRLKDQNYTLHDKTYQISRHGFARDMKFSVNRISDACVAFSICANDDTRKVYPYEFEFTVQYTLDGASLKKEHIVHNQSTEPLYYEVGGHDAYRLSFEHANLTDYYVAFEGMDNLQTIVSDADAFLSQSHRTLPLDQGRFFLTREVFHPDTVILEHLPVRRCTLGCTKHDHKIQMDFTDFDYFAMWSPYKSDVDVPFVCLEPWSTLPDGAYLDHALEHKVGIRTVAPGQSETLAFTVTIS